MTIEQDQLRRRRTQRLRLRVPVFVCGKVGDERVFEEEAFAVEVSGHGGLLVLRSQVKTGQWMKLRHERTGNEELLCMVVRQEPAPDGSIRVGVEFCDARPAFWHVAFPPDDWLKQSKTDASEARGKVSLEGRTYLQDEIRRVITEHWGLLKNVFQQDERLSFGRGELRSVILLYCGPEAGYSFTFIGFPLESFRFSVQELNQFVPLRPMVRAMVRFIEPSSGRIEGLFCRVGDPRR